MIAFEQRLADATPAVGPAEERQALAKAVDLYGGDPLPSCYEDWVLSERQRLSEAFAGALERLAELLISRREYQQAIAYLQRLARHDPLREPTYRRLMQLYALSGDRAAALRIYHACATTLQRELDAEPGLETRQAYKRLLNLAEPPAAPERPLTIATLVGREREWAALQRAWDGATRRPALALITGEAGIGKTRLAEELLEWAARQGITSAAARCYAAEGRLAYTPVLDWLRTVPFRAAVRALDRAWLGELARLMPELLAERADLPPPGPLTEAWQRRRLFEALARAVLSTRQPILLLLDDLQWCDQDTLEWLHYLIRFDERASLLVVATLRAEEAARARRPPWPRR